MNHNLHTIEMAFRIITNIVFQTILNDREQREAISDIYEYLTKYFNDK